MCFHFLYIQTLCRNLRSSTYDFCPLIMQEQIGIGHQSFPYNFVANCSEVVRVSWEIGKVEKQKALNPHKKESNKKGCVGKFTER